MKPRDRIAVRVLGYRKEAVILGVDGERVEKAGIIDGPEKGSK